MTVRKYGKWMLVLLLTAAIAWCFLPKLSGTDEVCAEEQSISRQDTEEGVWHGCNENTGYQLLILDEAGLFSSDDMEYLWQEMAPISEYGNVLIVTLATNEYANVERWSEKFYHSEYGSQSGTVFVIDMDCRKVAIFSDGEIYQSIDETKADIITDNVYTYASDAEYAECASKALEQIHAVLKGKRIAQPMKYLSNGCLAILLSLLLNYAAAKLLSGQMKPQDRALLQNMYSKYELREPSVSFTHSRRVYSPRNTGSSSGGGHSGGGHSGGGRSGGGGSHSF